ncbi:MAG: tetratricopeptide repeat protein [Planctomycetota bacterium]|jgi:serine/threonine-protein kinase
MSDKSILLRLSEQGQPANKVDLRGTERGENAKTRYELAGELARGGVGVVHRGRDNDLGREVALKVLREEYLANPELVRRFVEEAQIGAQLQHPGIVPVYELGLRDNQRPYFAMKLVKGETLAARLAKKENRRRLLAVFREACRTVAYAHARGVIHRDLKPANIMIGSFGEVQVVDWGFAKVLRAGGLDDERLAKTAEKLSTMIATVRTGDDNNPSIPGSVMGTPAYMPPEQALGHVESLDAKSDVFSLGAILCEILTGAPPFKSIMEASMCDLKEVDKRLDGCGADEKLVSLCRRALSPLPADRPADAQVLADEVADYLSQAEGRAHRMQVRAAKSRARAEQQARARRFTVMLAAGGLAAVLLIGGTFLWIEGQQAAHDRRQAQAIAAAVREAETAQDDAQALAAARRARDLGASVGALIAKLEGKVEQSRRIDARDRFAAELLAALEEAGSKHGDREFTAKQVDADYEAAFAERGLTLENVGERLAGAPQCNEIAAALEHWAYARSKNKELSERAHRAAQSLDPSIGVLAETVVEPDAIEGIAPTRLAIMGWTLNKKKRHEEAEALLRAGQAKYPDHFWLNTALGTTLASYRKKHAESARFFAAARGMRPNSIEAIHKLGRAFEQSRNFTEAVETFERGVAMNPEWAHGWSHLGQAYNLVGEHEKALRAARTAVRLDPESTFNRAGLAIALQRTGDLEGAAAEWKKSTAMNPPRLMERARLKLERGDAQGALDDLQRAVPSLDTPETHQLLAEALKELNRHDEALRHARRSVELGPKNPAAWLNLAPYLTRANRFDEAEAACKKAVELAPDDATGWSTLSRFLREHGNDLEGALAAAERAVRVDKNDFHAWFALGWAYRAKGDNARAAKAWLEAARRAKDPKWKSQALGSASTPLSDLGRQDEAIRVAREAVELQPKSAQAHRQVAGLLLAAKDPEGAVEWARKAIALGGKQDAHETLASGLAAQKWYRGAIAAMRKSLEFDATTAAGWTKLGGWQVAAGDYDDALESFETATSRGLSPVGWASIGMIVGYRGDHEAAIEAYEEGHRRGPNAVIHYRWGLSLLALGRFEQAVEQQKKALVLSPKDVRIKRQLDLAVAHVGLHKRLLGGDPKPKDKDEARELARVCYAIGRYADAVRYFREAGTIQPYAVLAVCAATRAGKGTREQAWTWMKETLKESPTPWFQYVFLRHRALAPLREERPEFWKELQAAYDARR